jgi:NTP pyrophosphatase (non-canonical NTP hydrolase)
VLNKLRDEIHQNAVEHGWWDEPRTFGEIIALCHSELSEALEAYRNGDEPTKIYFPCTHKHDFGCSYPACSPEKCRHYPESRNRPEGIPIELADCIIRILDYCGQEGIDIEEAVRLKMQYNKTRPYRHGGKKI